MARQGSTDGEVLSQIVAEKSSPERNLDARGEFTLSTAGRPAAPGGPDETC